MEKFFVHIYDWFERHKTVFWIVLTALVLFFAGAALRVRFDEQVTSFFPDDKEGARTSLVFNNLKVKDNIIVMLSAADSVPADDAPDMLVDAADRFEGELRARLDSGEIRSVLVRVEAGEVGRTLDLVYDHLPIYLTAADYARLDTLLGADSLNARMARNFELIASPMGMALQGTILRDPLGVGSETLAALQTFSPTLNYALYDDHIFSQDLSTLLIVIAPARGIGDTGNNERLVGAIEDAAAAVSAAAPGVTADYFGGASVAVGNARQIKRDTMVTLTIALLIIVVFITLAFRNKWAVALIVLPVVFGGLFALGLIGLFGGSMSAIAIGAGAAVFGIAMSYSIHVVSHSNHVRDPRQVIRELAYPLTVGSFTTIGAFLGLLFTQSQLLRDFGLFSALTLVGTTLFCLIFLPHFLRRTGPEKPPGRLLRAIERINNYAFDRNKWLVGTVAALILIALFFYNRVGFDSDMANLNYMPPDVQRAEERMAAVFGSEERSVIFVSTGGDPDAAYAAYGRTGRQLDSLQAAGLVHGYTSAERFLVPPDLQRERIAAWEAYWAGGRRGTALAAVDDGGQRHGFRRGAFGPFRAALDRPYAVADFTADPDGLPDLLENWVSVSDGLTMFITQVRLDDAHKEAVYVAFGDDAEVVVVDRAYFANRMAQTVNDDFYLILFISSFLIFGALLISYGRIELALMAFFPMFVSWILILGVMGLLGIEFNIVNIILSTFIFGIGDDFSIFIMDGLLTDYRDGRKVLGAHKTAIFFSAFTIVVGMGALAFARHPALQSISMISVLGMCAVILVAFTLQPVIFRMFITSQTRHGGFPYTLLGLLNTIYCFVYFILGCAVLQGVAATLLILPVGRRKKKAWFHASVKGMTWLFLHTMFTTKRIEENAPGERFDTPGVIIANHQSFIDILVMLSLNPKLVMVTNSWVWRSPFFGRIVRYADFYHAAEGYDKLLEELRPRVEEGYSVMVFPEGTRSADGRIGRFHKGAFYLAEKLNLDIIPVVLYGNGLACSKRQPLYIKKAWLVSRILPRIRPADTTFGSGYRERAKGIGGWFRAQYDAVFETYNRPANPYFYDALIKNYTYKGPVLEWYMRIKVRMERSYRRFDELVPRDASVVDIGCGYGPLAYMLSLLSPRRRVTGVDYDAEKVALANHCFSRTENINFVHADATEYDLPAADAYVLNDMLHYLPYDAQDALLERCFARLNPGGCVIVRDGDADDATRHARTRRSERWSTRIVQFNKSAGRLWFTTADRLTATAARHGFTVTTEANDRRTSNKIFVMRKKEL